MYNRFEFFRANWWQLSYCNFLIDRFSSVNLIGQIETLLVLELCFALGKTSHQMLQNWIIASGRFSCWYEITKTKKVNLFFIQSSWKHDKQSPWGNLDFHSSSYNITIILGDFDLSVEELHVKTFCESYSLKCLIKQLTCYKNPAKPTCTYLVLNKVSRCFQSVETENF